MAAHILRCNLPPQHVQLQATLAHIEEGYTMPTFAWLARLWSRGADSLAPPVYRPHVEALEDRWLPAAVGSPTANFVEQIYRDILHRVADPGGRLAWSQAIDSGQLTPQEVALDIRGSDEGLGVQVNDFYVRFLRRNAEPGGLANWKVFLSTHSTEELEVQILSSQEYFLAQGGGTNAGLLAAVYRDVLGRAIASNEVGFWNVAITINRPQGIDGIARSPEARDDEVSGFYTSYLRRTAGPNESAAWAQLLEQGDLNRFINTDHVYASVQDNDDAILVSFILASQEYFQDAQTLTTFATIPGPS
jgi:hypothetical protein